MTADYGDYAGPEAEWEEYKTALWDKFASLPSMYAGDMRRAAIAVLADHPEWRAPEMTAKEVIDKLGAQIRILAVRRNSEDLHSVGNDMHKLAEPDAQALYDLLEDLGRHEMSELR